MCLWQRVSVHNAVIVCALCTVHCVYLEFVIIVLFCVLYALFTLYALPFDVNEWETYEEASVWSSVCTYDCVIDVSEFLMKKTSSPKFNDMTLNAVLGFVVPLRPRREREIEKRRKNRKNWNKQNEFVLLESKWFYGYFCYMYIMSGWIESQCRTHMYTGHCWNILRLNPLIQTIKQIEVHSWQIVIKSTQSSCECKCVNSMFAKNVCKKISWLSIMVFVFILFYFIFSTLIHSSQHSTVQNSTAQPEQAAFDRWCEHINTNTRSLARTHVHAIS